MQYEDEMLNLLSDERFQDWVLNGKDNTYWVTWLASNPDKAVLVGKAQSILQSLKAKKKELDADTSWNVLSEQINENSQLVYEPLHKKLSSKKFLRYAAAISLIILSVWVVFEKLNGSDEKLIYRTGFNEKIEILLSDQTVIKLNSNSAIEVYKQWQDTQHREVKLIQGEAFFEVTKITESHYSGFKVHSQLLTVEVFGTAFNMKSRRGETEVALIEGSIAIAIDEKRAIEMTPGQTITYLERNKKIIHIEQNAKSSTKWLDNKISLHNSSLIEIAEFIEDNYGVNVSVDNALRSKKLSGELPDDNLEFLMRAIEKSLDVEAVLNGRKLSITERTK